nr:leucine-rich repeat-containing protein kinase family protein [Pseudomonas sp. RIT-PI-S]
MEKLRSGKLAGATRLDLSLGLSELPPEVFSLADTLEVLNLSGNRLSALPAEMPRLKRLKVLFCSNNPFSALPEVLGACPALEMIGFKACELTHVPSQALPPGLRWLILTDNRIARLPDTFERYTRLQKLMLAANDLRELPPSLAECRRLELLRISSNQLGALPPWLLQLPRLAWLAYAGNPLCTSTDVCPTSAASIEWQALTLEHKLGEGASGQVYQARLAEGESVAVKCFKGTQTSDGSPEDEIAAALQVGRHPNLVPMRGRLEGHPESLPGLVMGLIEPSYQVLAGPPSLQSCTRDQYAPATRFSASTARTLLAGIASAAAHFHRYGVMHGDLYAHNILRRDDGHALIGDFGAASLYRADGGHTARALEAIEVRAFGILLEEVWARCEMPPPHWRALSEACQQPDLEARPRFTALEAALAS